MNKINKQSELHSDFEFELPKGRKIIIKIIGHNKVSTYPNNQHTQFISVERFLAPSIDTLAGDFEREAW